MQGKLYVSQDKKEHFLNFHDNKAKRSAKQLRSTLSILWLLFLSGNSKVVGEEKKSYSGHLLTEADRSKKASKYIIQPL